jgi:crotonobetainyl-CoA:carnitine CoA-transferase CaiB-like acyl-CoA transferase
MQQDAFAGIKVIAVTRVIAAPYAAYQLALHGADVLTIEAPGEGDVYRYSGGHGTSLTARAMATGFLAQGSNKKSLTLNIAKPEGQEILRRLAMDADVLIENLRTGAMERYGLGYEALAQLNPRLVYCSVTGYGQTGPKRRDPAMDMAIQAASGMMSVTGTPESGPIKTSYPGVDYATGMSATMGILTALFQRERTGRGQHVDVSMLETALVLMSSFVTDYVTGGMEHGLVGNGSGRGGYVHNSFRTRNGVLLIAAGTELRRGRLWKALGMPDIYSDARFATDELRRRNLPALEREIEKRLQEKDAEAWESLMQAAGVTAMAVRTIAQIVEHPQIAARDFFHSFEADEELGVRITVPKTSYKLSASPARLKSPPPRIGQHTEEVLAGLGYDAAGIARLRDEGVV